MTQAKKLIEVAMPVKEISAESVRDKSIRHGHISTLHLWWARRPLPVCRAVVFASLVPDPEDENCPQVFRDAVEILLGKENNLGDPYKPYDDIPYTSAIDRMEDTHRNRLLMFIGKFSDKYAENAKAGKTTASKDQLSNASLIKWDNKNNDLIIGKARKLIWVAHNAAKGSSVTALLAEFDTYYNAIKKAEKSLYSAPDRHLASEDTKAKEAALQEAIEAFLDLMPKVFDPFAGGGAIPLEAARLGCRSYGNDINPVAHIIQKGSLEFPQKYGKPITYSKEEFIKQYGEELWQQQPQENKVKLNGDAVSIIIPNRLAFDVEYYATKMLSLAEKESGPLFPVNNKGIKPIAYYWVWYAKCSNPTCKAEVPLLKQFYLSQRRKSPKSEWIYFAPKIIGNKVELELKTGEFNKEGFVQNRKTLICPCCGSTTTNKELKEQFINGIAKPKMVAAIEEINKKKFFREPFAHELSLIVDREKITVKPLETLPIANTKQFDVCPWGFTKYNHLFSDRQLLTMQSLTNALNSLQNDMGDELSNYKEAIIIYLSFLINRIAMRNTMFNTWHIQQDTVEKVFGRQAVPMVFDYPEMNIFSEYTSAAKSQLQQIIDYINSEGNNKFFASSYNAVSGDREQFKAKEITASITDPPYYDAIAYSDLSDFFYVWMKLSLGKIFPLVFSTPLSPKTEECTAIKYHHNGSIEDATKHFEDKLHQIFSAIEHQTSDLVSIMFAHQSTEAWTTLCNSILGSKMNITGSWAVDTESTSGLKDGKSYLASSITVSCRPSLSTGFGDYKVVKKSIQKTVAKEVEVLYKLGFRGADLLTACFGQAVSEFGKYEKVEKADGSEVTVAELLEMARESAFNALLKGFDGDEYTKFYIGWLELNGFSESDFDDAAKFAKAGLTINVAELFREHLFIKNKNKQTLASFTERISLNKKLGEEPGSFLIDQVHRAMALYKGTNRGALLKHIAKVGSSPEGSFWRVITSLSEVLPAGSEDHKQAIGLLTNRDSLIRESKDASITPAEQGKLEFV